MATTTTGPTSGGRVSTPASPARPEPRPGRGRLPTRPRLGARTGLAVAMVAAGGLLGAWLWGGASQRDTVLLLTHDIPYGQVLTGADLAPTAVIVDPGVATVPADQLAAMVGQVAATNLTAGTLLTRAELTSAAPPDPGQLLIGLPVPGDRLPAGGLVAGDRVLVIDTPTADADPPAATPASIAAVVVRVGPADLNGRQVLDLAVPAAHGPALAVRAATGRFVIALQPPPPAPPTAPSPAAPAAAAAPAPAGVVGGGS